MVVGSTESATTRMLFSLCFMIKKRDDKVSRCVHCARMMWNIANKEQKSLLNSDAIGMFLSQLKMKVPSWVCKSGVSAASRSMWKSAKRYHPLSTSVTMATTTNVMHWCTHIRPTKPYVHIIHKRNGMHSMHTRLLHANIVHLSTNTRDAFSTSGMFLWMGDQRQIIAIK